MSNNIKNLIIINRDANTNIAILEKNIESFEIKTPKNKANFANLCIALKGYRMISEATEAILLNDNVVLTKDGEYYEKIADSNCETNCPPTTEDKAGSDYDADKVKVDA